MNQTLMKPVVCGIVAATIDRMYLLEKDMSSSIYFGAAVAVGQYAAEYLQPVAMLVDAPSLSESLYGTKTLTQRIVEIGSSTAMIYILNKYILRNDTYLLTSSELVRRVGVIAASDLIGTYVVEYFNGQKLEFLTDQ